MESTGEDLSKIEIVASQYEPQKYAFIENNLSIQPREIQAVFPSVPPQPTALQTELATVVDSSETILGYTLKLSWKPPAIGGEFIAGYQIQTKLGLRGAWSSITEVYSQQFDIPNVLRDQEYYIRIASLLLDNKTSAWLEIGPILIGYNGVSTDFSDSRNIFILGSIG